jgi:transposase
VLVELSVMEHRYQAVLAIVQDGWKISEVAERLGVSRQTVHNLRQNVSRNPRWSQQCLAGNRHAFGSG